MPKIFISYRREDSKHAVGRLHAALKRHVRNPKRDIFMDIDNIPRGVDFVDHLEGQVAQCDVMLAVIGSSWLSARDPKTRSRRLDDPSDFVRIEIASALKRGIPVVPVVLDDTAIPAATDLPEDLKSLARRNGERLEHESFDSDVARLIRNLPGTKPKAAASSAPSPAKPPAARAKSTPATWIGTVVALGLLAIGGGAWVWFGNPGDWRGLGLTASSPGVLNPVAARMSPEEAAPVLINAELEARIAAADLDRGEAVSRKCMSCHDLARGGSARIGPPLFGVVGRRVASVAGYNYSPALLANASLVWDYPTLDQWIQNPQRHVPGAKMTFAGIDGEPTSEQDRANLIAYLESMRIEDAKLPEASPPAAATDPAPVVAKPAPRIIEKFRDCSGCPEMVKIPPGSFLMGAPKSQKGAEDAQPQHRVTIGYGFAMGVFETTIADWNKCVSAGACQPSHATWYSDPTLPVGGVTWLEAKAYTDWLSRQSGKAYRLPTEAEWEYAARAGTTTQFWTGARLLPSQARYQSSPDVNTVAVGSYPANPFGLHDTAGNVFEWVEDCWAASYTPQHPTDGSAYVGGPCKHRVFRGGSFFFPERTSDSTARLMNEPDDWAGYTGFRVARSLP